MRENNPLVSVVITCYNYARFVGQAIESALNQTYPNIEVIVVNDGSTDESEKIIKKYLKDKRIKYFYQNNCGQTKAKNNGIKNTQGEYIAFLDADDCWTQDKIEKQITLFEDDKNIGVVYSDTHYVDENGKIIHNVNKKKYYSGYVTKQLFYDNFLNFSSAIVRRECFNRIGLFDETLFMAIDWDLWLRISTEYKILFLNEATLYYRIWPGQMSKNIAKRYEYIWKIRERFVKTFPNQIDKQTVNDAWSKSYVERAWYAREKENNRIKAIMYYFKSLKFNPLNWYAYRGMLKTIIP